MSVPVSVDYPWHKEECLYTSEGSFYRWRIGVRWEEYGDDREAVADGVGAMVLTEIGRYTPPGYRERVFYTRQFVLPSGERVGRPKLRVIAAAGFTRLCRGYRYGYEVVDSRENVRIEPDGPELEDLADASSW